MLGKALPANDSASYEPVKRRRAPLRLSSASNGRWAPREEGSGREAGRGEELAASGEVTPPQAFRANRHVGGDRNRQHGAERVVPAEQAVAGRRDGDAIRPQDSGGEAGGERHHCANPGGASIDVARAGGKARPDTAELDDDEEQDSDPACVVDGEDPGGTE